MTRINDVAKIMYDQMTQMGQQPTANDIARALDAAGHLAPDLPEPDNAIPGWEVGDLSITPGAANGSVSLDWEKPYDPVYGAVCRTLNLTPDQVQAILAAHYHREDQE